MKTFQLDLNFILNKKYVQISLNVFENFNCHPSINSFPFYSQFEFKLTVFIRVGIEPTTL